MSRETDILDTLTSKVRVLGILGKVAGGGVLPPRIDARAYAENVRKGFMASMTDIPDTAPTDDPALTLLGYLTAADLTGRAMGKALHAITMIIQAASLHLAGSPEVAVELSAVPHGTLAEFQIYKGTWHIADVDLTIGVAQTPDKPEPVVAGMTFVLYPEWMAEVQSKIVLDDDPLTTS